MDMEEFGNMMFGNQEWHFCGTNPQAVELVQLAVDPPESCNGGVPHWFIYLRGNDVRGGGRAVPVKYCPICGVELPSVCAP